MITLTEFRTPEEAALQLELLLLGTLLDGPPTEGPIAVTPVSEERRARALRRTVERLHELAASGEESVGIVGGVSASRRAQTSSSIAALLAAKHPATLLDVDLRAALLSYDSRAFAQEGLVDVVRYGVRSPRVVAPTSVPGLSLLPVGSGTVDLAGTWAADSFEPLLRELARSGDLLIVNGPGAEDLEDAAPLIDRVAHWILLHEIGATDAETTRRIRDSIGVDRLIGILVLHPGHAASVADESSAARPKRASEPADLSAPAQERIPVPDLEETLVSSNTSDAGTPSEAEIFPASTAGPRRAGSMRALALLAVLVAAGVFFLPRFLKKPEPTVSTTVESTSVPTTPATTEPVASEPSATTPPPEPESSANLPQEQPPRVAAPPTEEPAAGGVPPAEKQVAAVTPPAEMPAPPPTKPAPAAIAGVPGAFAIHISSMQTEAKAGEDAARLRAAGLSVYLRRVDLGEKGIWHRVYVGPFPDRAMAESAAASIRTRGLSDYTMIQRVTSQGPGSGR